MTSRTAQPTSRLPVWAALCLAAGAVALVWWASGLRPYDGPAHMIGPYRLPLALEYAVGTVSLAAAIAVLVARPTPHAARGLSLASIRHLVTAAVVSAVLWRVATAGGDGTNIGGGLAALIGPFPVAGLLVAAVLAERRARGGALPWFGLWLSLALAPVLPAAWWWTR